MSHPCSPPTLKALHETPTAPIYAVGASDAAPVELLRVILDNLDYAPKPHSLCYPPTDDTARLSVVQYTCQSH